MEQAPNVAPSFRVVLSIDSRANWNGLIEHQLREWERKHLPFLIGVEERVPRQRVLGLLKAQAVSHADALDDDHTMFDSLVQHTSHTIEGKFCFAFRVQVWRFDGTERS